MSAGTIYEVDQQGEPIPSTGRALPDMTTSDLLECRSGDALWKPQSEKTVRYIGEFNPLHRAHLYGFMCQRAGRYEFAVSVEDIGIIGAFGLGGGDMANDALDQMFEQRGSNPLAWLLATPFMVALGALLIGDGNRALVELWERKATGTPAPLAHIPF